MISLLVVSSFVVLLFTLVLHHLRIVSTEKTHNAACKDLLAGKSRVRAMLLQENSRMFFLVTSNGDIFIEPMKSLSLKVFPPTITLTEAKTHMKTDWNIHDTFEEHTGNTGHYLALRRNPDIVKDTFLVLVKTDSTYICGYFGFKLQPGKVTPNPAVAICCKRYEETVPDFWLGLLSQPLGMVWTSTQKGGKDRYVYCIIYSFPDPKQGKSLGCESVSPWTPKSQCLGYIAEGIDPKKERPLAGFAYWDGNIAVLVHNTSTVYVYKNIKPKSGKLKEKSDTLPEPLKYQIQEFIKCYEPKVNKKDKPPKKEELDKTKNELPKSDSSDSEEEDPTTESQGKRLRNIILGLGGVTVLVLIGVWFLFKSKFAEVRPRKRKCKPIDISKALAEWPQKATPLPGKSTVPMETHSTPRVSTLPEMLKKASKVILRHITSTSTTPATTASSPLRRRVSHTYKNPSKAPKSSPAESPAPRRQSKASKASPVRPATSPVAPRKVTKKLDAIKKSLVKSLAHLKKRKKRKKRK